MCPRCLGAGCDFCRDQTISTATYYTFQTVANRQREEALEFIRKFMSDRGHTGQVSEDFLLVCMAAIQYGKNAYLKKRDADKETHKDTARFGFLEWEAGEEREQEAYQIAGVLDL